MVIRVAGKVVFHTSLVIAGLAALLAVALGAAAYRLSRGPVSIAFLVPYVQNALKGGDRGYSLLVDDVILTWGGWERTLEIRVRGLRVLNRARSTVATVPEAIVNLSGRALFRGMLAPTRLELIGPNVRLVRFPDGRIVFGITGADDPGGPAASGEAFRELVRELTGPPNLERPLGYLRQVAVVDADLAIYDQASETIWRGPGTHLNLVRDIRGISGDLSTGILLAERVWNLNVTGVYDSGSKIAHLTIGFDDVDPAVLAGEHEIFQALAPIEMPVSGSISFNVGTEGSAPEAPAIDFDLSAGPGRLVLPEPFGEPLEFDSLSARGRLEQADGQIVVRDFSARSGPTELSAQGLLFYGRDEERGAIIDASFAGLRVEDLGKYWPASIKPKSRAWIMENLSDGVVRDGTVHIVAPPGSAEGGKLPEDAVDLRFSLDGMTVRYMRTLPLITGLSAKGRMTGKGLFLTAGVGEVGGLELSEGAFSIPNLLSKPPIAEASFVISGSSIDAMRLLDSEQLNFIGRIGLRPEDVGGQSATRVRLEFPLRPGVGVKDVAFAAAANMSGLAMPTQIEGLRVTDGSVQLRANPAGMSAGGNIRLNGIPMAMTWTKTFNLPDQIDSRYRLSGELDDAAREALNIPTADYLAGPITGTLEVASRGQTLVRAEGQLDLTHAKVTVPPIYWTKAAGVPGQLEFALTPGGDGGFLVERLTVAAGDLEVAGQLDFGPGFSIDGLDLGRLAFGQTDVSLALKRTPDGGYDITVGGASYDLRPNLAAEKNEGPDTGAPKEKGAPLKVRARLGQLIIEDNQILEDVTATAVYTGDLWRQAEIAGVFAGGRPVTLVLTPGDQVRHLTIESEDGGSVGKGLDIYRNAVGGKLTLSAVIDDRKPTHPIEGRLIVDEFQVVNAPLVAQILTIGSLAGIVDLLQGEGISFKRLDSSFVYDRGVLYLKDTRAFGSAVGFTLKGSLERATKAVNFTGTVVPAYTLNTALENVPVLGKLLLGGEGEGVFAVTFAVTGSLDKPRVTVNPLSALAPGFLRGLMSILTPGAAPAPQTEPPQTEPLQTEPFQTEPSQTEPPR